MQDSLTTEAPILYDLSCEIKQIELECGAQTEFELVVTNNSPRSSTCLITVERELGEEEQSVEPDNIKIKEKKKLSIKKKKEIKKLIEITHLEQQDFEARETGVIEFQVQTLPNAFSEESKIKILLADEKNPDEFYAKHTLPLILKSKPKKSKWRWLKWVLVALGVILFFFLLVLILKPSVIEVPNVVGLTQEKAIEELHDLGFTTKIQYATYDDLDNSLIQNLDKQRQILIEDLVNPYKKEEWLEKIKTKLDFPPINGKTIFQQTSSEVMQKGSEIIIHSVPEIITLPKLASLTTSKASQLLGEQGLRFSIQESFPPEYTYLTRSQFKNVWSVSPQQTILWEDYWPNVVPSYQEKESSNTEPTLVYKGTRIKLNVIPEKITVPKFTNINLLKLSEFKTFNLVYLFDKKKFILSDLIHQDNIHRKHGKHLYIYDQSIKASELIDSQKHQIILSLDQKKL